MSMYEIIPASLAIKSMRDSGYKDAAHAAAELIDNSIQAGLNSNKEAGTDVELICVEEIRHATQRQRSVLAEVAIYDNASGMDEDILQRALQFGYGTNLDPQFQQGIGKFGMGLPNASISQARRVDVYSWQMGKCLHTHLDLDEVLSGDMVAIPKPESDNIPDEWRARLKSKMLPHGTLVIWSDLDKVKWRTAKKFIEKSGLIVGRIYRRFIADNRARIRMASYTRNKKSCTFETYVKVNDPMYLSKGTSTPDPFDKKPAFDLFQECPIKCTINGKKHTVTIKAAMAKQEARDEGGQSKFGKHAAANVGVSLMRADRELELSQAFTKPSEPRERWWGIEVDFPPALDDVFGVTNNKQHAVNFINMDLDEDAAQLSMSPGEYRELLREEDDPQLLMYTIIEHVKRFHGTMEKRIVKQKAKKHVVVDSRGLKIGRAEQAAKKATDKRKKNENITGQSDGEESQSAEEKVAGITKWLIEQGESEDEASNRAKVVVEVRSKYLWELTDIQGPMLFDVTSRSGVLCVAFNQNNPLYTQVLDGLIPSEDAEVMINPMYDTLRLLFMSWARLEDEAGDERRELMQELRYDWGRLAKKFIEENG